MAHALCSSTQLLSVIKSVCKGRHSGAGGGGVAAGSVDRKERARVQVSGHGGRGGGPQGGWLELRGIWSYSKRRRAHFHATHAKSLTSRSPASHPLAAQTTSAKGSKFGQVFFFYFLLSFFISSFQNKSFTFTTATISF